MSRFLGACVATAAAAVVVFLAMTPSPGPAEEHEYGHVCLGTDDEPPGCP